MSKHKHKKNKPSRAKRKEQRQKQREARVASLQQFFKTFQRLRGSKQLPLSHVLEDLEKTAPPWATEMHPTPIEDVL